MGTGMLVLVIVGITKCLSLVAYADQGYSTYYTPPYVRKCQIYNLNLFIYFTTTYGNDHYESDSIGERLDLYITWFRHRILKFSLDNIRDRVSNFEIYLKYSIT